MEGADRQSDAKCMQAGTANLEVADPKRTQFQDRMAVPLRGPFRCRFEGGGGFGLAAAQRLANAPSNLGPLFNSPIRVHPCPSVVWYLSGSLCLRGSKFVWIRVHSWLNCSPPAEWKEQIGRATPSVCKRARQISKWLIPNEPNFKIAWPSRFAVRFAAVLRGGVASGSLQHNDLPMRRPIWVRFSTPRSVCIRVHPWFGTSPGLCVFMVQNSCGFVSIRG